MNQPIENYVPQSHAQFFRRQAWRVWIISSLVVLAWVSLILLPPVAAASGSTNISAPIYKFFSYICHQIPERSFYVLEHQFGVCSRCFGVYFGLLLGFAGYPLVRRIDEIEPLPRFWLFLAMIPVGIDWLLGVFGIWENTHLSRFLTGAVLGAACAVYIVPALVEIFRLLTPKNKLKRLSS